MAARKRQTTRKGGTQSHWPTSRGLGIGSQGCRAHRVPLAGGAVARPLQEGDTLMFGQPKSAPRRASRLCSRLAPVSALHILFAVGLMLLLLTHQVYAVQITLAWDPSSSADVGGDYLYYWQGTAPTPTRLGVDQQTLYTLTALAAGQTYSFAVTAYAVSKSQE